MELEPLIQAAPPGGALLCINHQRDPYGGGAVATPPETPWPLLGQAATQ